MTQEEKKLSEQAIEFFKRKIMINQNLYMKRF